MHADLLQLVARKARSYQSGPVSGVARKARADVARRQSSAVARVARIARCCVRGSYGAAVAHQSAVGRGAAAVGRRVCSRAGAWMIAALLVAVAGCGWHPRGSVALAPELQQLRLLADPKDPRLEGRLRRAMHVSGVELVETPTAFALQTGPEELSLRNVALDRAARSAEQEMRITLSFALRNPDGDLVFGPRELVASRIFAYDPNSVIAKQDEEMLIREELQQELVAQLLRQLRRVDATALR